MKNFLSNPIKKRIIEEIKGILASHPKYKDSVDGVQNKFSFEERPQRGVIVNNLSADKMALSADNYIGRLNSFCMLAKVENKPGTTLEWIRENVPLLESISPRRDIFPSHPGSYVISIKSIPDISSDIPGKFTVEPILEVIAEPLLVFQDSDSSDAQLTREGIYPGSVRLWLDGKRALLPGIDFSIDYESGLITFLKSTPAGSFVSADYKYRIPTQGPFPFYSEREDHTSIPGVVLAFGDRFQLGDEQAIVITDRRVEVAEVYGGKFEINLDLLAFTRDSTDREKFSSYIITKFLEIQNDLGNDGIDLLDISPGGEDEETYIEGSDDLYYESSISLSLRVDWELNYPLPVSVWRAEMTSKTKETSTGYLDGSFVLDSLRVGDNLDILAAKTYIGRKTTFEFIR